MCMPNSPDMTAAGGPPKSPSSDEALKRSVLFLTVLSSFVTPFLVSAINVALPAIQDDFHMNAVLLAWIATAYLLSCAVFLVPFGKMADIYGRRRVFICGISVVTVSSLLCAAAPNTAALLTFRVLQGLGTAMIFSTGMAILTSAFPPNERGKAIGISVAAVYIGLSVGPLLGGLLTQYFTWRSVFVVTSILGIPTTYFSIWKLKSEWYGTPGEKLDVAGSLLYALAVSLIMYGLSMLPANESLWELVAGLVLIIAFIKWELHVTQPVFNVELFANNRAFAFSSLAALINYSATFAVTFLLSLYLQYIRGFDPKTAGLILMTQPIMMAAFSPFAGKLSDRIETRKVASIGMAVTAAGLLGMAFLGYDTPMPYIIGDLLVLGFGFALFSSPNMNAIMSSVEPRFYGLASGAVSSMRLLGQMVSMGLATLVFSLYIGRVKITPEHYPAFLKSVDTAFMIFAAVCALGILASLARGGAPAEDREALLSRDKPEQFE